MSTVDTSLCRKILALTMAICHGLRMDMTTAELRAILKRAALTQEGFAALLGASDRSGQRWATQTVPPPVATLAWLLDTRPELLPVLQARAAEASIAALNANCASRDPG
jgi:DNA-binding transcriptional regulator YiaG